MKVVKYILFLLSLIIAEQPCKAFSTADTPEAVSPAGCFKVTGNWQDLCSSESKMDSILAKFERDEVPSVCTLDGFVYGKVKFRDDLSQRLYFGDGKTDKEGCHEFGKSEIISRAFAIHLAHSLPTEDKEALEKTIVQYVDYMGVDTENITKILNGLRATKKIMADRHKRAKIFAFLKSVSSNMAHYTSQRTQTGNAKVAILYSQSGGSHVSIARVLEKTIASDIPTKMINESEIYNESDILRRVVGIERSKVYNEIFQRANKPWCRSKLHALQNYLEKFIPDQKMEILRREVGLTSVIVATGHKPHNVRLASDKDRQICFQLCDYGHFTAKLAKIAETVLKFGLKGITFHIPSKSTTLLVDGIKLDFSDPATLAKYSDNIKLHAYPVPDSFKSHAFMDPTLLRKQVKSRYKLRPESRIYVMIMGQQGVEGILEKYIDSMLYGIIIDQELRAIDSLILVGKNEKMAQSLKQHLIHRTAQLDDTARHKVEQYLKFHFVGLVPQEEIALLGTASNVFLSKPGGATTAEAIAGQFPMIIHLDGKHEWERGNAQELSKLGAPILKEGMEYNFYAIAKMRAENGRIAKQHGVPTENISSTVKLTLKGKKRKHTD